MLNKTGSSKDVYSLSLTEHWLHILRFNCQNLREEQSNKIQVCVCIKIIKVKIFK